MAKRIDETNLGYLISKIKAAFWPKTDVVQISIDTTPTANSTNLVTSGGVKDYVDNSIPSVPVQDVTVDGTSVVNNQGVAEVPAIPDEVEANPTVPSGTTPTNLTGLKVGSDYYNVAGGGGTVTDVTVGGTSVVNNQGVAEVPAIPSDSNLVHKTGAETISGEKTFDANLDLTANSVLNFITDSVTPDGVAVQANEVNGEIQLSFSSIDSDSQVRLRNVSIPLTDLDVANKLYVDESILDIYEYKVNLACQFGTNGLHQKSLCAFYLTNGGTTMFVSSFTTTSGTSSKSPITGCTFPIGCKIYYNDSSSDASSGVSANGTRFYTSFFGVDVRYSAITGTSISLGNNPTETYSTVYLRVSIDGSYWSPYYKSGETNEIIVSSNQLVADNFYIYLGKTVGTTGYTIQLEDNNPLYYYNGTSLVDWASYISSVGSSGLPSGGTTGQVLAKASNTNYDVTWVNQGGGSAGTLDTTNTTALTPSASESLGGSVSLHKVSKTGTYSDLIGTPTYALGETTGGPASLTVGLPYGTIDSTSTGTLMTATVNGITALRDGVTCIIVNNVVGSDTGYTLNVNNLGAKPVYYFYDDTTQSATAFTVGKTEMFVYDSTKVSGGCWNMMYPFDPAFSASTYLIRTYYSTLPLATALGRYRLLFISADGTKFVPANSSTSTSATSAKTVTTEKIDPFGKIVLYNTTTTRTAGQTVNISYQYLQNRLTLGYSFNRTGVALTLTTNTPVYVKCSPQTDGSVMIDGTTPFVQALPNSEDGYVYIYLGIATSATQIELMLNHPVYQYKGGKIIQYLPSDSNLVHKTGAETIAGLKTFSDGIDISAESTLRLLTGQNAGVTMFSSEVNGEKILTFSDGQNSQVRLSEVADPVQVHDAVNKGYVDGAISAMVNNETLLNGRSGTYGLPIKSLVVCSESVNGMTWLMEPLTTTGGSGDKTPNSTPHFPIGSKIYYHPDDTAFSANTDFTSKTFYSTYNNVDARYSATNGSSLSLGSSSTSNVYLRVVASPSGSTWNVYDKGNIIVTSGNLVADNFYIYLGKTVGSTAYTFQLEDNNPLYYYDGTKLIDWARYVSSNLYSAGDGIGVANGVISHNGWNYYEGLPSNTTINDGGFVLGVGGIVSSMPSGVYVINANALISNPNERQLQAHLVMRYKLSQSGVLTSIAATSVTLPSYRSSVSGMMYGASSVSLQGVISLSVAPSYFYCELGVYVERDGGTNATLWASAPLSGTGITEELDPSDEHDPSATNIIIYRIGDALKPFNPT